MSWRNLNQGVYEIFMGFILKLLEDPGQLQIMIQLKSISWISYYLNITFHYMRYFTRFGTICTI